MYPNRSGGLVKYSTDLASAVSNICEVIYAYPGKLGFFDKKIKIIKDKKYDEFDCYKINNALPIPVFAGIKDVNMYTQKGNIDVYVQFLKNKEIDIVHIHTLMGLHIELLEAAHKLEIPIVMTVHDYFGVCPTTTLFRNGDECTESGISCKCGECSQYAFSYFKLAAAQTSIYKMLKKNVLFKKYRKKVLVDNKNANTYLRDGMDNINYQVLREYYLNQFRLVDMFLFNSNQTKEIFEKRISFSDSRVLALLHSGIKDARKKKAFMQNGTMNIGFLGELTQFKGYDLACEIVQELNSKGCQVLLDVYNDAAQESKVIRKKGNYNVHEIERVFSEIDILLVPSRWRETLSFIVLEALAHGVPCVVSDRVGAKMFIRQGITGYVLPPLKDIFVSTLYEIYNNPNSLVEINANIIDENYDFRMEKHISDVIDIYKYMQSKEG